MIHKLREGGWKDHITNFICFKNEVHLLYCKDPCPQDVGRHSQGQRTSGGLKGPIGEIDGGNSRGEGAIEDEKRSGVQSKDLKKQVADLARVN